MSMGDLTDDTSNEDPEPRSPKKQDGSKTYTGNIETDVYAAAADCLDAVLKQRASVRSAIFSSLFENKRFLLALTQKTVDHLPHIKKLVYDSQILLREPRLTKSMAYVLTYDLLFGDTRKPKGAAFLVLPFLSELQELLKKYMDERSFKSVEQLKTPTAQASHIPRYVRVNTLKTTTEEVVAKLQEDNFELVEYDTASISQKTFMKLIAKQKPLQFFLDFHVPNLLIFHPTVIFHQHELEKMGMVILQDKASCLPSLLLNPPSGATVIDACAAPGMKTSHLAALMGNEGKILAVDINEARCKTMQNILLHYDVKCAEVVTEDFLKVIPQDEKFSAATHILVDPTCTGSGVTTKLGGARKDSKKKHGKTKDDRQRLQKLKGLQTTLLKHALSFPNVQRVVYSTCSVNPEEDEEVVQEAMKSYSSQFVVKPFSSYLPKWKGCGKPRYSVGPNCLRAFPEKHRTNGFFVVVIEKVTTGEEASLEVSVDGSSTETKDVDATQEKEDQAEVVNEDCDAAAEEGKRRSRKRRRRVRDEATEHWSIGDQSTKSILKKTKP